MEQRCSYSSKKAPFISQIGGQKGPSAMTLIASLLFAIALAASISTIVLTMGHSMPRILEVVEMEFAPAMQRERRIIFGEVKGRKALPAAQVIAFPRKAVAEAEYRLAA
jgi:hypothetical protein